MAESETQEALLRVAAAIAGADPTVRDAGGVQQRCVFCGRSADTPGRTMVQGFAHAGRCPWLEARRLAETDGTPDVAAAPELRAQGMFPPLDPDLDDLQVLADDARAGALSDVYDQQLLGELAVKAMLRLQRLRRAVEHAKQLADGLAAATIEASNHQLSQSWAYLWEQLRDALDKDRKADDRARRMDPRLTDALAHVLRTLDDLGMPLRAQAEWLTVASSWLDGDVPLEIAHIDPGRLIDGVRRFASQRGDSPERTVLDNIEDEIDADPDRAPRKDALHQQMVLEQLASCEHKNLRGEERAELRQSGERIGGGRIVLIRWVPADRCQDCDALIYDAHTRRVLDHAVDIAERQPYPGEYIYDWHTVEHAYLRDRDSEEQP